MSQMAKIRFPFIFYTLVAVVLVLSCSKEDEPPADTGAIKIISLTSTDSVIKAFTDTATITVVATGDNLEYKWTYNHGRVIGSGAIVRYAACQSCIGLNTITCTAFNDSASASKDIKILVTSYFDH
jgi:hypothetical protein